MRQSVSRTAPPKKIRLAEEAAKRADTKLNDNVKQIMYLQRQYSDATMLFPSTSCR